MITEKCVKHQCYANRSHPTLPRCPNTARWIGTGTGNLTDDWTWCDEHKPPDGFRKRLSNKRSRRKRMNIKLIFDDWKKNFVSIYDTEKGMELSSGVFHSGTTFDATIILNEENERQLRDALANGYKPYFLGGIEGR